VLKSRAGSRLGAGAVTDGVDLLENGLERIVAGGLLGVTDGREGVNERGALGVNDGREGAIEGDLPELNGELWLRDGPGLGLGLGLGLMASRLAAMFWIAALRSEAASARREPDNPISRAAVSTIDIAAALRSFLSPATNMVVSFPSPAAHDSASPFRRRRPTCLIVGLRYRMILQNTRAATINILGKRVYGLHEPCRKARQIALFHSRYSHLHAPDHRSSCALSFLL